MPIAAPLPADEEQRLQRLRELAVLDTPGEPVFDEIARAASMICATPIALVSLIDAQRQWFKANVGLADVGETPRDLAFCAHAILGDQVFEVADAARDPRFADNPLVTAAPGIRFYAGAPLTLPGGERVGTLCVIDRSTRTLAPEQRAQLATLARIATQALLMRRELLERALAVRSEYEDRIAQREAYFRGIVEQQSELVSLSRPEGELVYVNPAYARHFGLEPRQILGRSLFEFVQPADWPAVRRQTDDVLATGISRSGENRVRLGDGSERWIAWTNHRQVDTEGRTLLHSVGRDITDRKRLEQRLVERERFVRLISDSVPVRIAYIDRDLRYRFVNRALCLAYGLERAAIIGRRRSELTGRGVGDIVARAEAALRGEEQHFEMEEAADGRARRIEARLIPDVDEEGQVRGLFGIGIDVTERSSNERAMRALSATLGAVLEAIPAIVSVVGADGRYRWVNHAFERWVGGERDAIVGRAMAEVIGPVEHERSRPWTERVLAGETVSFDKAYPERGASSHLAISFVPLRLPDGSVDGFVSVAQDITHHKREEVRLLQLAQRDSLTGLLNRSGFEDFVQRCAPTADDGSTMALLYIDLDRFKPVNDNHGHVVGDELLRQFARRMQGLVRPTDAVARLGGDEFAIALAGVRDPVAADRVAEMVVDAAAGPFEVDGRRLGIGASVGVALGEHADGGWRDLIARADTALYRAKAAGRGRWVVDGPQNPN